MIRDLILIKPHYRNKVCVVCGMFKLLSWVIVVVAGAVAV